MIAGHRILRPSETVNMPRKTNGVGVQAEDAQICVVMVGLPARGKSYIAQKGEFELQERYQIAMSSGEHCSVARQSTVTS